MFVKKTFKRCKRRTPNISGQFIVQLDGAVKEAALARLRPHARERQISVLTGGAGAKRRVGLNLRGKSLWFTGSQNFCEAR